MKSSSFLSLQWKDALKGFITAALTALLMGLYAIIQNGNMPSASQWQVIGISALGAGVAYLIKNVFTNSNDQFLKKEPPKTE